ncbi:hypothetical protein [Legionella moravica]|uniref:hypothetical protein n=1 Tax=Legionella moravica TaxID=39962 RepID=UPI0004185121|nr:hypothetical protein [Legionella moravica]
MFTLIAFLHPLRLNVVTEEGDRVFISELLEFSNQHPKEFWRSLGLFNNNGIVYHLPKDWDKINVLFQSIKI